MPEGTTHLTLWLEEILGGWALPAIGLAVLGGTGVLYLLGWASEEHTAALAVAVVALGIALFMVRRGLAGAGSDRVVALAAAAATLVAVALPAIESVWPGAPIFEGELGMEGDRMAIPQGVSGPVRLLVAGRLREGGEPSATYVIDGLSRPVEGRLERVYRQVRVGRGGRARVAADHTADWYDVVIPRGTHELTLRRVSGQLGGRLLISAHRALPPQPWPWVLSGAALLLSALGEARLGKRSGLAVPAGMGLAFGHLVTAFATPLSAVGPVMGAAMLGAIAGSLAGWIAGALARRLLPSGRTP